MTAHHSDILLPRAAWGEGLTRTRLAAFVPITVALVGVAAILSGGLTARTNPAAAIDPMVTASIAAPAMSDAERRQIMMMLDR